MKKNLNQPKRPQPRQKAVRKTPTILEDLRSATNTLEDLLENLIGQKSPVGHAAGIRKAADLVGRAADNLNRAQSTIEATLDEI